MIKYLFVILYVSGVITQIQKIIDRMPDMFLERKAFYLLNLNLKIISTHKILLS